MAGGCSGTCPDVRLNWRDAEKSLRNSLQRSTDHLIALYGLIGSFPADLRENRTAALRELSKLRYVTSYGPKTSIIAFR